MAEGSGPCLKHCYRCSATVSTVSKLAIVVTVGTISSYLFVSDAVHRFEDSLPRESRARFSKMRFRALFHFVFAGTLAAAVLQSSRPYRADAKKIETQG